MHMRMQARTRKLEAESKLAGLQKDLAELGSVSGDQAGQEEAQTMQLHQVWHSRPSWSETVTSKKCCMLLQRGGRLQ